MSKYRHYSFDLWLTLIRSNPSFKKERAKFIFDNFNQFQKPLEEAEKAFRRIDLLANAINEKTGKHMDTDELYLMVISEFNDHQYDLQSVDLAALYNEMEQLFFRFMPRVYCNETKKVLETLYKRGDCTISLLSNTAFIKGSTLRQVLQQLEIGSYFKFQIYSDETGMSKPNILLFRKMIDQVAISRNNELIPLQEIVHIGDNNKADIDGANAAGIQSLLINSNNRCISSLLN
ncbi:putative hydrolase of the HAD superfamily [Chitinophaga terrae (ex Kim and Jung 2007)]|uniref:Putative hydrolase of the HAD superfamily n=1 Tax=Chitinophaga terrae (ex Kim and Jung 2007) TaxID=408074 RepID=A0A1H4DBQ8_9BACT|nr:HAD family hydrolase [Chitinophaga terrae (ex Kim and Jung 2007)]MDQ0107786.1 putative hydrolase of the HAD superfamily [Chitinophaga terrae (ex Kim and Jung 2007)]GEP92604.1 hypothetical protein CTE07_42490 [Chitinophaga terrae (ex Kim and Jung 2007)]SEA69880.1 putative hydrolase of the HAD superfamily [Chitinophaga terrae (ex Kim and Jung 2007)]